MVTRYLRSWGRYLGARYDFRLGALSRFFFAASSRCSSGWYGRWSCRERANAMRRKILIFVLQFIPIFAICLWLYPHMLSVVQRIVVPGIDVGLHLVQPPMRIELTDDVIDSKLATVCASCHTCVVRCPRGIDVPRVYEAVRLLTLRQNEDAGEALAPGKRFGTILVEKGVLQPLIVRPDPTGRAIDPARHTELRFEIGPRRLGPAIRARDPGGGHGCRGRRHRADCGRGLSRADLGSQGQERPDDPGERGDAAHRRVLPFRGGSDH